MIGLVSGPQALPAPSVYMFGNPQKREKQKHENETYNQRDYCLSMLFSVFSTVPMCDVTFLIFPDWLILHSSPFIAENLLRNSPPAGGRRTRTKVQQEARPVTALVQSRLSCLTSVVTNQPVTFL